MFHRFIRLVASIASVLAAAMAIDYWQSGELALKTYVSGEACELNDRHLMATLAQLGWTTVMVVWRIHWQALRLWLKGVSFHRKPNPPTLETTR
jgi:DUF1365 family protein